MRGEFEGIADLIGDAAVMDELLDEVFRQMEEIDGEELRISLTNTTDVDSFFNELENVGRVPIEGETFKVGIDTDLLKDTQVEELAANAIAAIQSMRPEIEGVIVLTSEQALTLQQLILDVDGAFAAANQHVADSQAAITAGIQAQIPVFAAYTEAVALVATEFSTSADAWSADLATVAEGTASLAAHLTPAEIKIFNEQSVGKQASFFKAITAGVIEDAMHGEGVVKGLWEDLSTLMSIDNLDQVKIDVEIGRIMDEAAVILNTGITTLIDAAGQGGEDIPEAFIRRFNAGVGGFGTAATDWMGLIADELEATIEGPTITAPTFIGGSTTYTVNVTTTGSSNVGRDVSRALQFAGGSPQQ